jgi:methionyl aminopeptidase
VIAIRTEKEIDLMRQANAIVAHAHKLAATMIQPGVRTDEIDRAVEALILSEGGKPAFKGYRGYPASTCISIEEEVVHGIPGARKLQAGQVVSIDIGASYKGYFGDAAVTHACSGVDLLRVRLLDVTDLALSRAIRQARTGGHLNDIGKVIEQTAHDAGFSVVRDYVGHGIGTQMHEEPQVLNFDNRMPGPELREGMVLAIEPMLNAGTDEVRSKSDGWTVVTADGKPSAHFEHTVVVREAGGEILSWCDAPMWGDKQD